MMVLFSWGKRLAIHLMHFQRASLWLPGVIWRSMKVPVSFKSLNLNSCHDHIILRANGLLSSWYPLRRKEPWSYLGQRAALFII